MSELKLTGEHTVSLKVLSTSASKVNFLIRAVEFVESTVPVIYFNINEEDGTIAEMNASSDHSVECYGSMTIKVPDGFVSEYTGKEVTGGTYNMEYIEDVEIIHGLLLKSHTRLSLIKKQTFLEWERINTGYCLLTIMITVFLEIRLHIG